MKMKNVLLCVSVAGIACAVRSERGQTHLSTFLGLPTAWAPLETVGLGRQESELLFFDYRIGPVWAPSKELYQWAEFKCGDKSVLLSGTDRRVEGMGYGNAGFGHIALYAGKNQLRQPGSDLLGEVRLRIKNAGGPWNEPWPCDTAVREGDEIVRTRAWRLHGTNGVYVYRAKAVGPGKVRISWDVGVDEKAWKACGLVREMDFFVDVPKGCAKPGQPAERQWEYGADDPRRHVSVKMSPPGPQGTLDIDFHESCAPRLPPLPAVGGVDFWRTDAYDVPVRPGRNQVMNGSFEQGLKGWTFHVRGMALSAVTNAPAGYRFTRVDEGGKFGRHALHFDNRGLKGSVPGLSSAPMALDPGKVYTVSAWMRGDKKGMCFLSMDPAGRESKQEWVGGKIPKTLVNLTPEWQRISFPFIASAEGEKVLIWLSADDTWIDGVMVEPGDTATDTVFDPVEAHFVTSDPNNYLRKDAALNAGLVLSGAPSLSGKLDVEVENYYHERLYSRRFDFTLNEKGEGRLNLDDLKADALGTGIFIVRFRFAAADKEWRDYCRFTIIEPLDGTHPLAGYFAHFPWFKGVFGCTWSPDYADDLAGRMRDWGIGATATVSNDEYADGHWAKYFREMPMVDKMHTVNDELSHLYPKDFGWGKVGLRAYTNATPAELSFVEDAAYRVARAAHPSSRYWALGGEEELWHPLVNRDRDFDKYFKFQYACWKGLKRGFDERGLKFLYAPSQGTSAFFHITQHSVIDGYLTAADRQGFKYDFVAIHTYHSVDGSVLGAGDRDADGDVLLGILRKHGYPEATPISFPEGFNMLPMHIPVWRAIDWADRYQGTIPSLALGNRETLQAATLCRGYLVDLKRYPRLVVEHTWLHRPVVDISMTPYAFTMVMNTLGRLLPDPRFVGDAKPYSDVRGYCFHPTPDDRRGVLAVWTTNHDVENGVRKGDVLTMDLPKDATFVDFMGNERKVEKSGGGGQRTVRVPLTAAPLFILSGDAEGLVKALRTARGGRKDVKLERKWRQVAVPKAKAGARPPENNQVTLDGRKRGDVSAEASFRWNEEMFALTVRTKGGMALDVEFDGLIDARRTGAGELGPDDFAFRFTKDAVKRTKAANTQFRYGGASKAALTDEQAEQAVVWTCRPTADGLCWDISFDRKLISPVRLENGNCFGLNLTVRSDNGEASLAPEPSPQAFAELMLD